MIVALMTLVQEETLKNILTDTTIKDVAVANIMIASGPEFGLDLVSQ